MPKIIKEKLGLIGVGNMGTAIVEGLLKNKIITPSQVWVYDKMTEKAKTFSKGWRVHLASSNEELVKKTNVVVFAIKPQDLAKTSLEIKQVLTKTHQIISILAGVPVAKIEKELGGTVKVVRAMPNLGARVGQGITAVTAEHRAALEIAKVVFSGCGKVVKLDEPFFDLVTALSGSGPAYFFLMMELLSQAGVKRGLDKKTADLLAVQTALGAGLLAERSSVTPEELRKMVTSKGGTTEAALQCLKKGNLSTLMDSAVQAALERGQALGRATH